MPIRRPLLTEGLPPDPVFDPAFLALVGLYYQIAAGVVVPAAHAASHQAGGTDALTLTQAQITGLVAALAAKANLAGAAFTGAVTVAVSGDSNALRVVASTGHLLVGTATDITAYGGAKVIISETGSSTAPLQWRGRIVCGGQAAVFLLGEYNGQAWLGAHNTALTAWADLYINPNGPQSVHIGTRAGTTGQTILKIANAGNGAVTIGYQGTPVEKVVVYTPTLTPTLIAGLGLAEQTFNVPGLSTSDTITLNGPAPAAGTAPVAWRVSAADTLAISFETTAINLTPSAGVYRVVAFRS